jgi:peptidoglycan hydrolase CwlO-like protein
MDSNTLSNFFLFGLGIITTVVTALLTMWVSKNSAKLVRGRSIKEVVDSANAIIEMYEKHVGALETKVGDLEDKITGLQNKLDETLKHNEALQKLLMLSPAMQLTVTAESGK